MMATIDNRNNSTTIHNQLKTEPWFDYAEQLGFGELHFKLDEATGLRGIVGIHSTKNGPALGGCRFIHYSSVQDAIRDVLRLSRGMSYKNAMAGLPLGGGKSVLIKPAQLHDRKRYFQAFGRFVNDLGGRYIVAMDSGTNVEDMDVMHETTKFVTNTSDQQGDPSPFTAIGVFHGIERTVAYKLGKDSLKGIRVAIQGLGHVGYSLAQKLHQAGANLIVTDVNQQQLDKAMKELNAEVVSTDSIFDVQCDVFAPCALGAILNDNTIPRLKTSIIAGAANNQLAEPKHGVILQERGILYAPDYVINAGGVIFAGMQYFSARGDLKDVNLNQHILERVQNIANTLFDIYERSKQEKIPTSELVDIMAKEKV